MPFPDVSDRTTSRGRVLVRAVLGMAQMIGAVASLVLLLQMGTSAPTLATISVTTSLRLVSYLLFRRSKAA
jgi:hypothetical protein